MHSCCVQFIVGGDSITLNRLLPTGNGFFKKKAKHRPTFIRHMLTIIVYLSFTAAVYIYFQKKWPIDIHIPYALYIVLIVNHWFMALANNLSSDLDQHKKIY